MTKVRRRLSPTPGPASGSGPSSKTSTPSSDSAPGMTASRPPDEVHVSIFWRSSASTSSSSPGSPTPSSASVQSLSLPPGRDDVFVFRESLVSSKNDSKMTSPDEPLPSIETRSESPAGTYTPSSRTTHARTPSVSVSPPPLASPHERGETESIAARLDDLNLTPTPSILGMSDVRVAISDIANGLEGQASPHQRLPASPSATELSPGPRTRRSRSASRTNLIPHDIKDEELPPNRFHDPAVQQAFGDAKSLMSRLVGVLEGSSLHASPDSTIERLHRQARDLSRFQCPSTRTVGFVGDSGVGKSSVLNALLDQEGLARTSNSGAACTCVVTEYHYHARKNFVIDVELFSQDDLMNQVTELLQSYRRFHLPTEGMGSDAEAEEFQDPANVARDTFRAMFRGRLDDEDFLVGKSEDHILSTLRSWLQNTRPTVGGRHTSDELQDCARLLTRLTSEGAETCGPAVWPYIRKIKVSLDSHILSKGLVLVDLPGLRDLNSARRSITERYLLQCDEILAICNIGRATTDAGVESVLELARLAGLSNVGIVCTKSDDIRADEAKKDWKGLRAGRIQQLSDAVASTQSRIDEIRLDLAEYEDMELTEEEKDDEIDLNRELRKTEKVLHQEHFELKRYLVETRNSVVTNKLQDQYGDKVPSGTLRVFCVSNTDYWAKRNVSKGEALPLLRLSGIIALRKHCLAIIGDSQLSIATKFVTDDIPALLGDVALWVESGAGSASAEQKRAVRETLDKVERRLKRDLTGRDSGLNCIGKTIKQEFKTRVYDYRCPAEWGRKAIEAGLDWNSWYHPTYSAFCRNYGNHTTGAAGRRDWNQEIIAGVVHDLAPRWDELRSAIENRLEDSNTMIDDAIDWAMGVFETELEAVPRAREILSQALVSRANVIVSKTQALFDEFNNSLDTLRIDSLSGVRTSLIGRAMESSYRNCNLQKGRGSDDKRKGIVNGTIQRPGLFPEHMAAFKAGLQASADDLQAGLQATIQMHLDVFGTTLDLIRNENVATESEENPELRMSLEREAAFATERLERIKEVMTS